MVGCGLADRAQSKKSEKRKENTLSVDKIIDLQLEGKYPPTRAEEGLPCLICIDGERETRLLEEMQPMLKAVVYAEHRELTHELLTMVNQTTERRGSLHKRHPKCPSCFLLFGEEHLAKPADASGLCQFCYSDATRGERIPF